MIFNSEYETIFNKLSPNGMQVRLLQKEDYDKNFFDLQQVLTTSPQLRRSHFEQIIAQQTVNPLLKYLTIVIEALEKNICVASGVLIVQTSLCGKYGFVENIVVHSDF